MICTLSGDLFNHDTKHDRVFVPNYIIFILKNLCISNIIVYFQLDDTVSTFKKLTQEIQTI